MELVASTRSGIVGNVGTGGSDLSSWRLTAEKYLSAAFFLSRPFCFLFDSDSSQLTPCLRGSRPKDELPFLLYLEHTERVKKIVFKMIKTHYIFIRALKFGQSFLSSMVCSMFWICNKL